MPAFIGIVIVILLSLYMCSGDDDDPYGFKTSHPTKEQLLRRELDDQNAAIGAMEDCLRYMRRKPGGRKDACPDE